MGSVGQRNALYSYECADEELSRIAERTTGRIPVIGFKAGSCFRSILDPCAALEFAQPSMAMCGETIDNDSEMPGKLSQRGHDCILKTPDPKGVLELRLSPPLLHPYSIGYGDCRHFSDGCPPPHILLPDDF
jgi:hypothetical protein